MRGSLSTNRFSAAARGLLALGLCAASAFLGGCVAPRGVDVNNNTGRTIKVEYMTVKADGSTQIYSEGMVSAASNVTYKVEEEGSNGVRIKFSLPEAPEDPGSQVILKMPENQTRYYNLEYISGRLVAREQKKWRNENQSEKSSKK